MSLINDVLQQLDARVPMMQPERVMVEESSNSNPATTHFLFSPIIKAAVLAALGFICGYSTLAAYRSSIFSSQPISNARSMLEVPLLLPNFTSEQSTISVPAELSLTGTLAPIDLSLQQSQESETLLMARQHFLADRLTYPPLNNAYQLYREVLLKAPANEAALNGIAAIKQRYITLTTEALTFGESEKARRYIERAEFVGVDVKDLRLMREQLHTLLSGASQLTDENSELSNSLISGENKDENKGLSEMLVSNDGDSPKELFNNPPADSFKVTLNAPPNIALIQGSLNNSSYKSAHKPPSLSPSVITGNDEQVFLDTLGVDQSSEALALNFIKTHENSADTVRWLARRWVNAQAWLQLLDLMNLSNGLTPVERDIFRAQALLGLNRYEDLIAWLKNIKGLEQPELLRILAVAMQKTGREADALVIYQHLVDRHPENSGLWLALGVSADAMENVSLAHQAYFRAQQLGGNTKAVNDFLSRKLNAAVH